MYKQKGWGTRSPTSHGKRETTPSETVLFYFMYIERATGEAIAHGVIECLKDRNIDISKARGQSYDGAQC